ncbi:Serine/threonine-protein kinase H1-like protein [Aphelenchoides fujianensis]|nr:Serine/threonine-protein kinase H1-like protein [Aphelenchoides fujianensis]
MGNKCSSRSQSKRATVVPAAGGRDEKKKNFFVQLFAKHRFDAAALAQTCPPPVGGEMPLGEAAYYPPPPHGKERRHEHHSPRADTQLFNKYDVISIIGKGSFSQVLRVQHRLTRQFYAVKLVSQDSDINAVNNELAILSRVQHPFVIRLEEVLRGANRLFIVMEMASGGEMYDRVVSKGRYTEVEARQALRMLLNGLAYLHDMKITHRDLKPENILYSDARPDARLLITDFGLAHQAKGSGEKMTETCGTPEYIAPEVLLRVPYTDKVDMWAVGVIAYILMSGIMPFDDDVRSRLYTQIITANYVYYPQYWSGSEHAKLFVDSLLETNPEMRLSAIDSLRNEWVLGEQRVHLNVSIKARPASEFNSMQRTKSTRSIRSVTRSDHGHRVDPHEVDRLANDLQQLAKNRTRNSSAAGGYEQQTKHYGVF